MLFSLFFYHGVLFFGFGFHVRPVPLDQEQFDTGGGYTTWNHHVGGNTAAAWLSTAFAGIRYRQFITPPDTTLIRKKWIMTKRTTTFHDRENLQNFLGDFKPDTSDFRVMIFAKLAGLETVEDGLVALLVCSVVSDDACRICVSGSYVAEGLDVASSQCGLSIHGAHRRVESCSEPLRISTKHLRFLNIIGGLR